MAGLCRGSSSDQRPTAGFHKRWRTELEVIRSVQLSTFPLGVGSKPTASVTSSLSLYVQSSSQGPIYTALMQLGQEFLEEAQITMSQHNPSSRTLEPQKMLRKVAESPYETSTCLAARAFRGQFLWSPNRARMQELLPLLSYVEMQFKLRLQLSKRPV